MKNGERNGFEVKVEIAPGFGAQSTVVHHCLGSALYGVQCRVTLGYAMQMTCV